MKQQARVVVIGGGIVGVSILYHLTRAGWSDVARITSGGYGHTLKRVIALAYIDTNVIESGNNLEAEILGERYLAKIIADSPYDPQNLVQT